MAALYFLVPLLLGFALNIASAFTTAYARRWGERRGSVIVFVLRNIFGIPLWVLGLVLAVRTPSPTTFAPTPSTDLLAWSLIAVGAAVTLIALISLRQPAVLPSTQDRLVRTGPYAHMRPPIHTGAMLQLMGVLVLISALPVALACLLSVVWMMFQSRAEESDLLDRIPAYREYMRTVPRFIPRLGADK